MDKYLNIQQLKQSNEMFRILVVGGFGSGKSSVINALLGQNIMPTYVLPSVQPPIVVKYGEKESAVVHFRFLPDSIQLNVFPDKIREHIQNYGSKSLPPLCVELSELGDVLSFSFNDDIPLMFYYDFIEKVELSIPLDMLKEEVEIIEMPSLSEITTHLQSTEENLSTANIILFVMSAWVPCGKEEMDFIEYIYKRDYGNILFVLNRYDSVPDKDKEPLKKYVKMKLDEFTNSEIFYISATHSLGSIRQDKDSFYKDSGIKLLLSEIEKFMCLTRGHITHQKQNSFMDNCNYFSWENLSEIANINSHIAFASTLMGKYDWEDATKLNLEKQLAAIVEKQNDKLLNISVIGEFSTGKSSFINALVGFELLAVNVIQGTTVAITIIEYSNDFSLTLTDFSGKSTKKVYKSIDTLRQQLHIYTTDPNYAKRINYVTVTLPSDVLKNGYRIIDTPGTNSLELWHETITRRAIKVISDLSIILTDATQPMTQTLMTFLEETLGDTIKNCSFVANKIDRIKDKERSGIVQYVERKVSRDFELQAPIVLPFSAVALTNTFARERVNVDDNSFLQTTESLQKLLSNTAKQRIKAQARKILHLIDGMYTILDGDMRKMADQYQKELELLERSRQADLKPFITSQTSMRQRSFLAEAKDYKYKVESACDSLVSKARSRIDKKIDDCISLDKLSEYIKGQLSVDIKEEGQAISNGANEKFGELKKFFKMELNKFQKDFEKEFQKLKILSIRFNIKPKDVTLRHTAHSANIHPVMTLVSEELSKENWAIGGGMGAGALLGTAILPGIGTVVGGLLGGFFGAAAAPDTSEVKKEVKSKLAIPMLSYYRSVASDCMTDYNNYARDISEYLESEINRYYSTYASTIQQRIQEWDEQHRSIKTKISKIEKEIAGLKNRQQVIQSIISKI